MVLNTFDQKASADMLEICVIDSYELCLPYKNIFNGRKIESAVCICMQQVCSIMQMLSVISKHLLRLVHLADEGSEELKYMSIL